LSLPHFDVRGVGVGVGWQIETVFGVKRVEGLKVCELDRANSCKRFAFVFGRIVDNSHVKVLV